MKIVLQFSAERPIWWILVVATFIPESVGIKSQWLLDVDNESSITFALVCVVLQWGSFLLEVLETGVSVDKDEEEWSCFELTKLFSSGQNLFPKTSAGSPGSLSFSSPTSISGWVITDGHRSSLKSLDILKC